MNEKNMTPGQLLSSARDAKGLSQADIAKQMRLSVQAINDIEQDEYAKIGVRTFVRGYLSTYARIVDVSKTHILDLFDASAVMSEVVCSGHAIIEGAPVMDVTRDGGARMPYSKRTLAGVAGFLAVALFLLWATDHSAETKKNTTRLPAETATVSLAVPTTAPTPVATVTQAPTMPTVPTTTLVPAAETTTAVPALTTTASTTPITSTTSTEQSAEAPKPTALTKNAIALKKQFVRREKIHKHEKPLAPTYTITPAS